MNYIFAPPLRTRLSPKIYRDIWDLNLTFEKKLARTSAELSNLTMSLFLRKPRAPPTEEAEIVDTRDFREEHVLNASITNWDSRSSMGRSSVNRRTCWEGH